MTDDQDHYEAYYGDKLWNLLPSVYRSLDTDQFNANGPLRELVNRIGIQAATIRRSLDRMWEDQSIETCDDWVIPYIGDLLATNLVASVDTRAQRLDVARTIYYRRRKGTLAILEEIAYDVTGWNVKLVEFFRRLGRTRHGLDPAIGLASVLDPDLLALQQAEGLVGPLTGTGLGGLADLRSVYGASKAGTAFDEFSHTADFRQGQGKVGWYGIPRVGVFLWRLQSFEVPQSTAVPSIKCPGHYTFDPTGRQIPLYAVAVAPNNYGDNWVSPAEWQLPTPITPSLLEPALADDPAYPLYAATESPGGPVTLNALGVYRPVAKDFELLPAGDFTTDRAKLAGASYSTLSSSQPQPVFLIDPANGLLTRDSSTPVFSHLDHLRVNYAYGFPSTIGAGPYDRRIGRTAPPTPDPRKKLSGGIDLVGSGVIPKSGTLTLGDSLTYPALDNLEVDGALTIQAAIENRPVIRLAPTPGGWTVRTITGNSNSASNCLVLDGLFFSGADLVLQGTFDCVTLTCCTLDPGSVAPPPTTSQPAASSLSSIFAAAIDGRELVPCRLWIEGQVGTLTVERCVTGPIRTRGSGQVATLTISDSIIQAIPTVEPGLASVPFSHIGSVPVSVPFSSPASVPFSASIPEDAADLALGSGDGDLILSRCTVLGRMAVHRLQASECILDDVARVDDTQHGCVRFTAWASGSTLPRQYESVTIAPGASLFTSTDFGRPGYGQLLPTVDAAILPTTGPASPALPTIASGAQNGSEMGAYARDLNPNKVRGLLIKYQEYMPAGLVPVLIDFT